MGAGADKEFFDSAKALSQDAKALRDEFCKLGLDTKGQEVFFKALNGCAQDSQCQSAYGLPKLDLFKGTNLIKDPNVTGDRMQWTTKKGPQELRSAPCDLASS